MSVNDKESEVFEMCENSNGALIEYTHKDNNSVFDNIFWNGEEQFTFKFRVIGGFKPSGVSIEIDNEQFVNQKAGNCRTICNSLYNQNFFNR